MEEMKASLCPYCGKEIAKEDMLFWESTKQQFNDEIRAKFLRSHSVPLSQGNKFDRKYYKPYFDGEQKNVYTEDANHYYATCLMDVPSNSMTPEQLAGSSDKSFSSFSNEDEALDDAYAYSSKKRVAEEKKRIVNRACPHCHCELPRKFGMLPIHHVTMFGIRAAGKTAYIVNLFQQINTQLSLNNLGSIILAEDSRLFLEPLIKEYEMTGSTSATVMDTRLLPIVCTYKNGNKEALIVFYDIAGEGTDDAAYVAEHKGVQACETLLLMIDPNMLCAGAYAATWEMKHNGAGEEHAGEVTLDAFLNNAGGICYEFADNLKSVVCVVTKMDMVLEKDSDLFGGANSKLEIVTDTGKKHMDHVHLAVVGKVQNELDHFLKTQYNIDLSRKIHEAFGENCRAYLLGVSTSTRVPSPAGDPKIHFEPRHSANDPKHRIVEPFLVVAMNFGLISAVDANGNVKIFQGNRGGVVSEVTNAPVQEVPKKPSDTKKKRGLFSWLFGGRK